jgi:hypothetical protein
VKLATVLGGATPFKANNINDTFRGLVQTDTGERPAIIKDLHAKELANEVLVAALGLTLGLPVPAPYIGLATPDRLPAQKGPEFDGGRLVYVSVDVQQPQVAMLCAAGVPVHAVLARLAQWADLGRLYGFDTLVANVDRHAGNLLFCGNKEVWLIDHGHCFTGPAWSAEDLEPADKSVPNRLNEWLTPSLDDTKRTAVAGKAATVPGEVSRMDLRALAEANYVANLLNDGDFEAVVAFVRDRCASTPKLSAASLGVGLVV